MVALVVLSFITAMPAISQAAENSLKEQLGKLGAKGGELLIMSDFQVTENIKIPENVTLKFTGTGKLIIKSKVTLEINGGISAPIAPIFQGEGRVSGRPRIDYVVPQWFGAKGDEIADDTQALQKAADLAQFSAKRLLMIPKGRYLLSSTVFMRCNVDAFGTLICNYQFDPKKVRLEQYWQINRYYPKSEATIKFSPDSRPLRLDGSAFYGLRAGSSKLPTVSGIHLKGKPNRPVDLTPSGTLTFRSRDFLSRASDTYYVKTESFMIATARGEIVPESLHSYPRVTTPKPWSPKKYYPRGSYCKVDGKIYKAINPSGPNSFAHCPMIGKTPVGSVKPVGRLTIREVANEKGKKKNLQVWVTFLFQVDYTPPQSPLTVNNLKIELICKEQPDALKLLKQSDVLQIWRSNMIFNNLHVVCNDKNILASKLIGITDVVGMTFNNAYVSGATMPMNGYNISSYSSANLVFNNCISVNCRNGYAGGNGKNILINGGTYYCIDEHFGYNYTIKDATIYGLAPQMTKRGKIKGAKFTPRSALNFNGGNFTVENCRVIAPKLLAVRSDTTQFFGNNSFRNLTMIWPDNVSLLWFKPFPKDLYIPGEPDRFPTRLLFENIVSMKEDLSQNGLDLFSYNPKGNNLMKIQIKSCKGLSRITALNTEVDFIDCGFNSPGFGADQNSKFDFVNCSFMGQIKGLTTQNVRKNFANLLLDGAEFPKK